jgi:hypothetical protein
MSEQMTDVPRYETVDDIAAHLFWALAALMKDSAIPREQVATYGPIILIRLCGWLLSHGLDDDEAILAQVKLHQDGLKLYAGGLPLMGEEGERLTELAENNFKDWGGGIPRPEGSA